MKASDYFFQLNELATGGANLTGQIEREIEARRGCLCLSDGGHLRATKSLGLFLVARNDDHQRPGNVMGSLIIKSSATKAIWIIRSGCSLYLAIVKTFCLLWWSLASSVREASNSIQVSNHEKCNFGTGATNLHSWPEAAESGQKRPGKRPVRQIKINQREAGHGNDNERKKITITIVVLVILVWVP